MLRTRALLALLVLALALPSAAFAQGAGDEQYQDPFGDEQAQNGGGGQGRTAQDDGDGLSDEPPIPDDGGSDPQPTDPGTSGDDGAAEEPAQTLPNTGSEPLLLAWAGLLFLLVGVGLRLRTLDPDSY